MTQSRQLAEDLRRAVGQLVRSTKQSAASMPAAEGAVLGLLDRDGPQSIAELAQARGVRHQSAAKTVKDLTAAGLVSAEAHPTDGRKLLVHITEPGRTALDEDRRCRADVLENAIEEELTAHERRELRRGIELLKRLSAQIRP
ncbi:MarR family winged helix-turn-helix transcriptional regulator [Streptomyces lancefieldiae]|uniref:MarR family transcriptional regulator n=1 Tax=Streptomyces lancefieldiae TaxID=3075520 RepID=A0ABU3AGR1_9ACTN|nr:MarR family transcriptional regulator [Streptomyces sp. DSM 40712]MDT0609108.1 MarR family transcriptional regulator [Streptomyces sp. DSM 40712]